MLKVQINSVQGQANRRQRSCKSDGFAYMSNFCNTSVIDCTEEIKGLIETEALMAKTTLPSRLWERLSLQMTKMHPDRAVTVMPRDEAINFIGYVRRQANGGDVFRQIETSPYVNVSDLDDRLFLQFNTFYNNKGKAQRIVGLGHPDLIRLLKIRGVSLFIDATYSITLAPFKQTLIVMGHDSKFDVYLPVLYILLEGKDEMTYTTVLHLIKMLTGMKLSPGSVTCDFETALINAIRDQFKGTRVIGCLFHWKQAIRRKLIDLRIPAEQIKQAMTRGVMDSLTVIPIDEIQKKGIPFVTSLITSHGYRTEWESFWRYFTQIWLKPFDPELWNVNAYVDSKMHLQNRTNNPIESYNCAIKRHIGDAHPEILAFVTKLKLETAKYLQMCDDISMERRRAPAHSDKVTLTIPVAYYDFIIPAANRGKSKQNQGKMTRKKKVISKTISVRKSPTTQRK